MSDFGARFIHICFPLRRCYSRNSAPVSASVTESINNSGLLAAEELVNGCIAVKGKMSIKKHQQQKTEQSKTTTKIKPNQPNENNNKKNPTQNQPTNKPDKAKQNQQIKTTKPNQPTKQNPTFFLP